MARREQVKSLKRREDSIIKILDRIIRFIGLVLIGVFFFGALWHFKTTGSIDRGMEQLKYMGTYFTSGNDYKDLMSQSYREAIQEKLLLDSLYHGDLTKDSIYHFTHEIFGSYLDNKSKRIVTLIIERSDLTLMEKIQFAEKELQKDFFTNREKELFRQRFAEIAKLFFLLSDESIDNKLDAAVYMIRLESFNPMNHYNTVKSIIDFSFHYTNEKNIGALTRALLLDRAYGDHVMKDWELEGFHSLQSEEVDSSFNHLHHYIQTAKLTGDQSLLFEIIRDFVVEMGKEDFAVYRVSHPEPIKKILIKNLKEVYRESLHFSNNPTQLVVCIELLLEIGKYDSRFYKKNIKIFNSFIEGMDKMPAEKQQESVERLQTVITKLRLEKVAVNEKYFLDKVNK